MSETYLTRRCRELHGKPVNEFTVEDLRIMLGQELDVPKLLPRAVEVLQADPLAEGDFYAGDLLKNVVTLPASAWHGREDLREDLAGVLRQAPLPDDVVGDVRRAVAEFLRIA